MKLQNHPPFHCTYCTNIHPGETWGDVFKTLQQYIPKVKNRIAPDQPFGIGLRLSALAAGTLVQQKNLEEFRRWMDEHNCYVFTMNGFPYGNFHGERVKDQVFKPDWSTKNRLQYTKTLIEILSAILPEGVEGSISTCPISYKHWHENEKDTRKTFSKATKNLVKIVRKLFELQKQNGQSIHLNLEPEPDCLISTGREAVSFFQNWLLRKGVEELSQEYGFSRKQAEQAIRDHIRICYDTCHFSVEYEDPEETFQLLDRYGIGIGKVQISSALKATWKSDHESNQAVKQQLSSLIEPTYLHQVKQKNPDDSFQRFPDLSDAMEHIPSRNPTEWRVHYHVPIFRSSLDGLKSTRNRIVRTLDQLTDREEECHLELETYTWDVLPPELKRDLLPSITREFRWFLERFQETFHKEVNCISSENDSN